MLSRRPGLSWRSVNSFPVTAHAVIGVHDFSSTGAVRSNNSRPTGRWNQDHALNCQRHFSSHVKAHAPKAWMDSNRTLASRVQALMETPLLHPAEIHIGSSSLDNLLVECCKLGNLEGMQLATEIMERVMVEKGRLRDEGVSLSVPARLWERVLFGWVKMADKQVVALERMRDLVETVVEEAKSDMKIPKDEETGNEPCASQPDVAFFNTYLRGLAEASKLSPGAALLAESTIFDMKDFYRQRGWHTKPNTRSYTFVITAHSKSGHPQAGERAVNILRHVQKEHETEAASYPKKFGMKYDEAIVINTTSPKIVTADSTMYTVTMNAVLHSKSPPIWVGKLLDEAVQARVADRIHFNLAINALGKKIEFTKNPLQRLRIAKQAEEILANSTKYSENSKDVAPITTANACLDVWSRAYVAEMGPRSEALLQEMMDGGITPDAVSFDHVIRAWSKSTKFHGEEAAKRAVATLQFQEALAEETSSRVDYPNFQAYALAILAYVGQEQHAIAKASDVLDSMVLKYRERRISTGSASNPCAPFAALLSVTASVPKNVDLTDAALFLSENESNVIHPYELACHVYEQVTENAYGIEGLVADHHFYAAFLRNLTTHGNPKAVDFEAMASRVWEQACETGQVSRLVWPLAGKIPSIRKSFPESEVRKTIDLPRFWWRNVPARWLK